MIFSKKVNCIVYGLLSLFFIVGIILIVRINIMYPNAIVVDNKETGFVEWLGCRIEAESVKVYSPQEYVDNFPKYAMHFEYMVNDRYDEAKEGVVVYTIKVTNTNNETIDFRPHMQAYACSEPSMWCNGLAPLTSDTTVLEAGQTKEYIVASSYQPSLVHSKYIDRMREEEFQLIFSNYPEKILLRFDK